MPSAFPLRSIPSGFTATTPPQPRPNVPPPCLIPQTRFLAPRPSLTKFARLSTSPTPSRSPVIAFNLLVAYGPVSYRQLVSTLPGFCRIRIVSMHLPNRCIAFGRELGEKNCKNCLGWYFGALYFQGGLLSAAASLCRPQRVQTLRRHATEEDHRSAYCVALLVF